MIVKCPHCETKYKLDPAKFTSPDPKIRCKKCNNVFKAVEESAAAAPAAPEPPAPAKAAAPPPPPPEPPAAKAAAPAPAAAPASGGGQLVVVAHDSADVTDMAADLLREAGYEVSVAHDGIQALMEIESRRPAVAVLDVALPKMFGFEIIEVVRRDAALAGVKLLLIAAIYDKTRYKRNPQTLYGADDYIEKHLIPDNLVEKVQALAAGAPAAAAAPQAPAPKPPAPEPKAAAPAAPAAAPKAAPAAAAPAAAGFDESTLSPAEKEDHEKAKRLARIVASDIALYSADALAEGLKKGNPYEALQRDIDEAKRLFSERVPANMRGRFDYLGLALEDLFAKKRKELGLAV